LEIAKIAAKKDKLISDLATEIDENWRVRLEVRRLAEVKK